MGRVVAERRSGVRVCWNGLLLGVVVLAVGLFHRTFRLSPEYKHWRDRENLRALCMLAIWVVPMVIVGTAVSFTEQPGHVLSYLPALMLLAAVVAGQLGNRRDFVVVTTMVCAVNAFTSLHGHNVGTLCFLASGARRARFGA